MYMLLVSRKGQRKRQNSEDWGIYMMIDRYIEYSLVGREREREKESKGVGISTP